VRISRCFFLAIGSIISPGVVSAGSCNVFDEAVETFIAEAYSLASLPASAC